MCMPIGAPKRYGKRWSVHAVAQASSSARTGQFYRMCFEGCAYEMGLNQKALAKLIGVSSSRLSDYISGKCEPTLKVARTISQKLNIDANIVLGV